MDAQNFRSLQEAYLEVYDDMDMGYDNKAARRARRESVDLYDIILSHLLDEGYAETPEAAKNIMVNMSEEWRESIVEGGRDEGPQPSMSQLDREEAARRRRSGSEPETLEQRIKRRAAEQRARGAGYGRGRRRYY